MNRILLLISMKTASEHKSLPARWGWGYRPSLDMHSCSSIPTHNFSQLSHPAAQELHTAVLRECSQILPETWIVSTSCILSSDPQYPRDPLLVQVGSEGGGHSSQQLRKRPPHPQALPAMLHALKSYTTTGWIAAQCIPLHFVTLPWSILCQKWLALTVLWWIEEFATLKQSWDFYLC